MKYFGCFHCECLCLYQTQPCGKVLWALLDFPVVFCLFRNVWCNMIQLCGGYVGQLKHQYKRLIFSYLLIGREKIYLAWNTFQQNHNWCFQIQPAVKTKCQQTAEPRGPTITSLERLIGLCQLRSSDEDQIKEKENNRNNVEYKYYMLKYHQ